MRHFKKFFLLLVAMCCMQAVMAEGDIRPVPFTDVHVTDQFWKQRLDVMAQTGIRYAFQKMEDGGLIRNFEYAGMIVSGEKKVGELTFQSYQPFDDADVYKVIEGAAYVLSVSRDAEIEATCDRVIDLICSAQEPDGYLQTNMTIHNPLHGWYGGVKWLNDWNLSHETFNVGELIEAGVAYYQATGKRKLLDCAIRATDNMLTVFNDDGIKMAPGHAVVEMALVRLYELTKEEKYLNACKFFLDCRGVRKFDPTSNDMRVNGKYWQDHLPAVDQRSAEGHAVRALYFYSGMSDWVRYSDDQGYATAINAIWENIATKKFYITGGFGARDNNEAFGEDYELPNATAYCETCASIAGTMFNERMFRLHGESKYVDMLERAMYNTAICGISIDGKAFFYPNRLESSTRGNERSAWFGCSCCPTNLARYVPSFPGYVYATDDDRQLYVNLFVNSTAEVSLGKERISVKQETGYPYAGTVKMTFEKVGDLAEGEGTCSNVRVRIPGWAVNKPVDSDLYAYTNPTTEPVKITIGGEAYAYTTDRGYAVLPFSAIGGKEVVIDFPMDVHQVVSNENLTTNAGLRSYERGPLVYCAEGIDNATALDQIYIPEGNVTYTLSTALTNLFNGNMPEIVINGMASKMIGDEQQEVAEKIHLIPYFARSHRTPCAMKVWMPVDNSVLGGKIDWLDEVVTCDAESESAHNLKGHNMRTGMDLGWRDAMNGWISYDMKVDPERPCDLVLRHWGSDSGPREFYIYCDGERFAYDHVDNFAPNQYYYMRHQIPFALTEGKEKVTIKMQSASADDMVGGLYGVYTALSEDTPPQTVVIDHMWNAKIDSRRQHGYSSNGGTGTFRGRTWADGSGETGQSWTMKVNPTNRNYLMICYWGDEGDVRNFNILCDGTLSGSESLYHNFPGRFFFRTYVLPEEATAGKEQVRIHLTSPSGTKTGGFFHACMMSAPTNGSDVDETLVPTASPVIYNLLGQQVPSLQPGVNILRSGAAARKVLWTAR